MNTYEKEKLRAMLKSFEETIDEVVIFDVIHPFPDVKPPRYSTYRSRSKKTSSPTPSIAANTLEYFLMIELLFLKRSFLTTSKVQIPSVVRMKIGLARALV
jgi:hypothetical protein